MTSLKSPGDYLANLASPAATPTQQLNRLLSTAGIATLPQTGWIRVTGDDRVRWLNGMVTNAIKDLAPGQGNYSFVLNAQGQIQGDLTAFAAEPDALLLEANAGQVPTLLSLFDRFIIMDDVHLQDLSHTRFGLLVAGPRAASLLSQIGLPAAESTPIAIQRAAWRGNATIDIISAYSPLVPRFELWADEITHSALAAELASAADLIAGGLVDADALDHLRLLEGTPSYGIDITPKNLAQETGQTRALHFSKGCYLGQEIVERIHSRGNVHRTFTAFRLEGTLPSLPASLTSLDKPIGELTSALSIPLPNSPMLIGLGIVRREALDRPAPILYTTPRGAGTAIPALIPVRG